jgi:hypothetical protein
MIFLAIIANKLAMVGMQGFVAHFVITTEQKIAKTVILGIFEREGEVMFFKKKQKDKVYSQYPCSVYLHNALRFIREGKPEAAYEEICWSLTRASAILYQSEYNFWKKIIEERERE